METGPSPSPAAVLSATALEQLVVGLALQRRERRLDRPHTLGEEVVPGDGAGRRVAVDDVDFARPVVDVLRRPQRRLAVLDVEVRS